MNTSGVALVGFEEFDNLGIGYIASVLRKNNIKTNILDFRESREDILMEVRRLNPIVVGFSVIFQLHIFEFSKLILFLRESGIKSHFSAGGQFASMRYTDLFNIMPSLDSIVRFEGEYTFLELVTRLKEGTDWHDLQGIAYKKNGNVVSTPLRAIETDLDKLPYPVRSPLKLFALGKKYATILAGRGCLNNCTFCNNTEYVRQSSIRFRRDRKPENVAAEMHYLYQKKNCPVFLFDDDDFPLTENHRRSSWVEEFCHELRRKKLDHKIIWKINCRPDEVDPERFKMMKDHGLFHVFLGLDDGTDAGLSNLNKHMTVAESLGGISILKSLGINFDYGFMLFQPSSTFKTIYDNLDFLKVLCGDGYTPVIFLKMMPYFATKIEKELEKEGRLKGGLDCRDYDFYDISLNRYYDSVVELFGNWLYNPNGFTNLSRWGMNFISVFSRYYKMTTSIPALFSEIRCVTSESNLFLIDTISRMAHVFESGNKRIADESDMAEFRSDIENHHKKFVDRISGAMRRVSYIAEYQNLCHMVI